MRFNGGGVHIIGGPTPGQKLLEIFMQTAQRGGYSRADVLRASLNLALDVVVKKHDKREPALKDVDQIHANMRNALGRCYNAAGSRLPMGAVGPAPNDLPE